MNHLTISLNNILVDLDHEVDLEALPVEDAQGVITRCYSFLPPPHEVAISKGVATISWLGKPPKNPAETEDLFDKAVKHAGRGNYVRAVDTLKRVLERQPDHVEARRNLGMAFLEMGQVEKGKEHLAQAARLSPDDPWTFLLLANVFSKYQGDHGKATRFYQRAYALNSNDPYILTSYTKGVSIVGSRPPFEECVGTHEIRLLLELAAALALRLFHVWDGVEALVANALVGERPQALGGLKLG